MIDIICNKCIHQDVCKWKKEAIKIVKQYNDSPVTSAAFHMDFRCNYYIIDPCFSTVKNGTVKFPEPKIY